MKGGLIFPVTSHYQAEAFDNLSQSPAVAQHFLSPSVFPAGGDGGSCVHVWGQKHLSCNLVP